MDDGVDGSAFGQGPLAAGGIAELGERDVADAFDFAAAAEDGGYVALLAALDENVAEEFFDAGVAVEVSVDEFGGLGLFDVEHFGEAERALAVDHAEIDGLGDAALGGVHFVEGDAVDLAGDAGVDVFVALEGGAKGFVAEK